VVWEGGGSNPAPYPMTDDDARVSQRGMGEQRANHVVLNWATGKTEAHRLDANRSTDP
jgi:hypothetical protein